MDTEKLTMNNINGLNGNYYEAVKSIVLDLVEVFYEKELENNKVNANFIDKIVNRIIESKEFNNYIDSFIQDEIKKVFNEDEVIEEEERE